MPGPVIRSRRSAAFCAALALSSLMLCGCQAMNPGWRGAELKLEGTVLVVPFRDAGDYYYDSADGLAIAQGAVHALLRNSASLDPLPVDMARGIVRSSMPERPDWYEVGKSVGADYVVAGSIDELRWRDPADQALPRCIFKLSYSVYSIAAKVEIYSTSKSGRYPFTLLADDGVSVFEMGADVFTARSREYMGETVARTFYGYVSSPDEREAVTSQTRSKKQ